jgi:lipopolysaccharide transport system ATP-binding protein
MILNYCFSELEKIIRISLRIYSSGMVMKLAFSVATAIEKDILFIDERLSVADKNFSIKAASHR